MNDRSWVKVEQQDGGNAFLVTTDRGLAKAFGDEGRALLWAESYSGVKLERRESAFGEVLHFAEFD